MLTVKLHYAQKIEIPPSAPKDDGPAFHIRCGTKIVEAECVNVHILRPGELFEISLNRSGPDGAFYIAPLGKPRPEGFADCVDFYYEAFIENASGKTVERVRFE